MKLAIIGNNPLALKVADFFDQQGAAISLYYNKERDFFKKPQSNTFQSALGCDFSDFYANEAQKILERLNERQFVSSKKVKRIQKSNLMRSEELGGRSRLADLFRVVFEEDPKKILEQQKERSPEAFEKVSEDVLESLKLNMENFEEVDLVIDCTGPVNFKQTMASDAYAIGEEILKQNHLLNYGVDAFDHLENIKAHSQKEFIEIALIGDSPLAACLVDLLRDELVQNKMRIFLISEKPQPFSQIKDHSLMTNISSIEDSYQLRATKFIEDLKKWNELEDYEKVKVIKPAEPLPNLVYFAGHSVCSVDRLIDKERFFLTLEFPEFRESHVQKENAKVPLKTVGVDYCFVMKDIESKPTLAHGLQENEVGYFYLSNLSDIETALEETMTTISQFFTRT